MKKNPALEDFKLIDGTSGTLCGGIWIKSDGSELKIKIAWKDGFLHFKPLDKDEKSLIKI